MATKDKPRDKMVKKEGKTGSSDVFRKFMLFIRSPIWRLPVISFIEQRSIVFDKDEPNEKLYKEMHGEFRSLIDALIESFCTDFNITPRDLIENVKDHKIKTKSYVEQAMLEPVIAAQDYQVFVHMMFRKNIELQLQAVQMIEIMCGLIPEVLQLEGVKVDPNCPEDHEHVLLVQIMKQSQEDQKTLKRSAKRLDPELEKALQESIVEKERLEKLHREEEDLLQRAMALSLEEDSRPKSGDGDSPEPKPQKRPSTAQKMRQHSMTDATVNKPDRPKSKTGGRTPTDLSQSTPAGGPQGLKLAKKNEEVHASDIELRKRYLIEQRDKLLAMKKQAREQAFSIAEKDSKGERPRTAQAARSAMKGRSAAASIDPAVLEARKQLAKKLKQEVMGL